MAGPQTFLLLSPAIAFSEVIVAAGAATAHFVSASTPAEKEKAVQDFARAFTRFGERETWVKAYSESVNIAKTARATLEILSSGASARAVAKYLASREALNKSTLFLR